MDSIDHQILHKDHLNNRFDENIHYLLPFDYDQFQLNYKQYVLLL